MRGARIHTDGRLRAAGLRSLMARLRVIGGRRLAALAFLLCAWALLLLAAAALPGRRKGTRRAWAMRIGALGVLWAPVAALITAALEPGAAVEYATIALACLALGALTDALLPWPRAPLAPGDRHRDRARGRRAPAHPTADALAARTEPDPRSAVLRHRQRAQVRARRARVRGRRGRAVSDRGLDRGGPAPRRRSRRRHDGRRRRPAGARGGLRADRRRRGRRDPRERRHGRRHRDAARRPR